MHFHLWTPTFFPTRFWLGRLKNLCIYIGNILIYVCVKNGWFSDRFELFKDMWRNGDGPHNFTLSTMTKPCRHIQRWVLEIGSWVVYLYVMGLVWMLWWVIHYTSMFIYGKCERNGDTGKGWWNVWGKFKICGTISYVVFYDIEFAFLCRVQRCKDVNASSFVKPTASSFSTHLACLSQLQQLEQACCLSQLSLVIWETFSLELEFCTKGLIKFHRLKH